MRLLALVAALAWGCNAPALHTPDAGCTEDGTLRILPTLTTRADVLVVVDDSPAMARYQARIEAELPPLIAGIIAASPSGSTWHVGVARADPADNATVRWVDGTQAGTGLAALLHSDDTGAADVEPLETAYRALHDPLPDNAYFLRADASLAVVLISAVDDGGAFDLSRYQGFFASPAAKGGVKIDPRNVVVAAIAPAGAARIGAIVSAVGAHVHVDIAAADWHAAVDALETTLFGALDVPCANRLVSDPTQPDCLAFDRTEHPDGTSDERQLPRCSPATPTDCWQLVADRRCDVYGSPGVRLDVARSTDPPPFTSTTFDCSQPCPQ